MSKKSVFCDCRLSEKCRSSLEGLGYSVLLLLPSDNLPLPVASHPDMICHRLEKDRWVFERNAYEKNKKLLDGHNLDIIVSKTIIGNIYSEDIAFNAARVGNKLICREDSLLPEIREHASKNNIKIINTSQGYAKCSSCITGDAVITSDKSIYKAAVSSGIDCLLISAGHIALNGYSTGFIGGCSGLLEPGLLAFTGNLYLHPDYLKIKDFTKSRGIDIICLSDEPLYDYGSILSI